jgi:hypothetical protein
MPGLQDAIRNHPLAAIGLGAVTIMALAPPSQRPALAKGVKAAVKLCMEAEGEAEGEIVERFAEAAIDDLVDALAHPEPEARHAAAHAVIRRYRKRARRRSARFTRDANDRRRRYARQISALEEKISLRRASASDRQRQGWERVLSALTAAPAV